MLIASGPLSCITGFMLKKTELCLAIHLILVSSRVLEINWKDLPHIPLIPTKHNSKLSLLLGISMYKPIFYDLE
jgi:hypothetical protein